MCGQGAGPVCLGIDKKSSYLGTAISDSWTILQSNSRPRLICGEAGEAADCNKS